MARQVHLVSTIVLLTDLVDGTTARLHLDDGTLGTTHLVMIGTTEEVEAASEDEEEAEADTQIEDLTATARTIEIDGTLEVDTIATVETTAVEEAEDQDGIGMTDEGGVGVVRLLAGKDRIGDLRRSAQDDRRHLPCLRMERRTIRSWTSSDGRRGLNRQQPLRSLYLLALRSPCHLRTL